MKLSIGNFHNVTADTFTVIATILLTLIIVELVYLVIGISIYKSALKRQSQKENKKGKKIMSLTALPLLLLEPFPAWVLCLVLLAGVLVLFYANVQVVNALRKIGVIKSEPVKEEPKVEEEVLPPIVFYDHEKEEEIVAELVRETITVEEAHEALADDIAMHFIAKDITSGTKDYSKKGIINIDTLSENFDDDSVVNLEVLLEKGLVAKGTDFVKVLARGQLSKRLNVEMQDYSSDAVKMIILTGGTVTKKS